MEGRWRGKGRGDRDGWRLSECDWQREAEKLDGEVKEVGQMKEREKYGEVIPSALIYVSINSRTGVCSPPLSGWPVELREGGGAPHSCRGGVQLAALRKQALDERCEDRLVGDSCSLWHLCWI